ncbi:hypothetical protein J1N35_017997 [Gossypium stocksii]|uniref:Uncharacterized protein n=1 Tax=Gossypium stocksii TaxID=47602 RepID=A0A9D3VQ19_9ROSI|nr:hypothetical protein J1N35_017997 [Gossypium stocksii]
MAKCFNVVQKQKRAQIAERKRLIHGDPATKKLKNKSQSLSVSGKRKRKLLKKWRREQKEVIEKGLVTMEDVEMVAAEGTTEDGGTSQDATIKVPTKFPMKKNLKLKRINRKGNPILSHATFSLVMLPGLEACIGHVCGT